MREIIYFRLPDFNKQHHETNLLSIKNVFSHMGILRVCSLSFNNSIYLTN